MSMQALRVGLDIGSTTIKLVVLDDNDSIIHKCYERHNSDLTTTLRSMLEGAAKLFEDRPITISITGSGSLSLRSILDIHFVQEVGAATTAIKRLHPECDTAIEIGGEDGKAIFIYEGGRTRKKMNSTCAAGTGAYIDRMAGLLAVSVQELNELASKADKPSPIAPRCGVFAQTDVQSLLNSNTPRSNIAAGILSAIATQIIGDIMQGKTKRCQNVILLGGPFCFLSELRAAVAHKLPHAQVFCPENAEILVAYGAALSSGKLRATTTFDSVLRNLNSAPKLEVGLSRLPKLFDSEEQYREFRTRHRTKIAHVDEADAVGPFYLGIDSGSTTFKAVLIDSSDRIVWTYYSSKQKNRLKDGMAEVAKISASYEIAHSVAIGYGEQSLVRSGLADSGEVETIAHLEAAMYLLPDVRLIIDIGGQDIKVFFIEDGVIEEITLNEACSSGCGAFLLTYVNSLGEGKYTLDEFDQLACKSTSPVNLGSRCTVFMNSAIKQAQREGAPLEDIAAGLSYSIVSNVFHKVLQVHSLDQLGGRIVVQGGTFLNDSVLRAFELTIGAEVIRPEIAGLMGAYGAAILAKNRSIDPSLMPEKPLHTASDLPNISDYKFKLLLGRRSEDFWPKSQTEPLGTIHIPLALNMFDNLPYWFGFWSSLGYKVVIGVAGSDTFDRGVDSIFSETICYPAKLVHGQIVELVEDAHANFIFFPSIKWELDERTEACNHVNCPVVMGYPEAIRNNMPLLAEHGVTIFTDYLPYDKPKALARHLQKIDILREVSRANIKAAIRVAEAEDAKFRAAIERAGQDALVFLKQTGAHGIVLAGHPYHVDPQISHGIAEICNELGFAVFTEDSIAHLGSYPELRVLNQWTYHARLYYAASFVAEQSNIDLIQLVSFGCGLDAITADQVKEILGAKGKIFTKLKIDAIKDSRPVRIRIRSLSAALKKRGVL